MQPNSHTNSKKTNVAVTSTFALCIPLSSTTKNIQFVTLPKYITLKSIASLGTIENAGYNHVSTYECKLTKNKNFQKFAKNFTQEIVEPLNPKDAFYGGRTNATKLLYNFKDNECGRYVDFCSLYPTVQYY